MTKCFFLAAAMALVTAPACAANLVVNPGFEDGDTGWTSTMVIGAYGTPFAHGSAYAAVTGCVYHGCVSELGSGAYVGQTINTVAGSSYTLSFWVGENTGPTSEMSVFWNGVQVADVLNPANNSGVNNVQFTFSNLFATSSTTAFEVHGRQDPGGIGFDDFSVTAVPEPESYAMMLAGLGVLGFLSRRKSAARFS